MVDEKMKRKLRSMEILAEHNVYCYSDLPCIEASDEVTIRTKEEIARRAIACYFTVQFAIDLVGYALEKEIDIEESKELFEWLVKKYGVEEYLTDKEKEIFQLKGTEQDAIDMMWKYEGFWVLMWSLGFVEELDFPTKTCDTQFITELVGSYENVDEIIANSKLRNIEQILDEADLIYRYDWNCVDAILNNKEADSGLDYEVVVERHRALNWLIECTDAEDWDNVAAHT